MHTPTDKVFQKEKALKMSGTILPKDIGMRPD